MLIDTQIELLVHKSFSSKWIELRQLRYLSVAQAFFGLLSYFVSSFIAQFAFDGDRSYLTCLSSHCCYTSSSLAASKSASSTHTVAPLSSSTGRKGGAVSVDSSRWVGKSDRTLNAIHGLRGRKSI